MYIPLTVSKVKVPVYRKTVMISLAYNISM